MSPGLLWGIAAVCVVLLVGVIVFIVIRTKQAQQDRARMEADLPVIRQNEQAAQYALYQNGIVCSAHYSNLGYKFIEYRTNAGDRRKIRLYLRDVGRYVHACRLRGDIRAYV